MNKKKYTIKDIARLADVSKGTVDRVLHRRGKVSKKALEQVNQVLEAIDYQPNPIARTLKNNKIYRICVLIPDQTVDPYWNPAHEGIKDAENEFKAFGVLIQKYVYDPLERCSFLKESQKALDSVPDVLLMAPLYRQESLEILQNCKTKNVLVVFFNNYIDALNSELFIGQDLHQSGRVAANLIDKLTKAEDTVAVVHIDKEPHMQLKENGFKEYFEERKKTPQKIITANFNSDCAKTFEKEVAEFLHLQRHITAVFITNSKSYRLLEVAKSINSDFVTIGYDLLEENINCLIQGEIDFLIHQKPKRQAYLGVSYLVEHFLFDKKIPEKMLLPIDIISSENFKYYLD
ncbi:LacI family DNA-binding transcriptional regulator [uncultured Kriegella sp.]|uniref:LacI family DNA-binding transcriptional regulator n=1 Tax=uncultured Kriegella sp. TaxID=1798910 RepID=UPI0030D75C8D|tara:strand:- start:32780 stop:33820 length:1041 start_codon:yes stop_codon:yes gene_type:complete